jgi:hypothetical protein
MWEDRFVLIFLYDLLVVLNAPVIKTSFWFMLMDFSNAAKKYHVKSEPLHQTNCIKPTSSDEWCFRILDITLVGASYVAFKWLVVQNSSECCWQQVWWNISNAASDKCHNGLLIPSPDQH